MRLAGFALALACACTGNGNGNESGGGDADTDADPVCTEAKDVACVDDLILDLSLQDDEVSDDEVSTTEDGDDFVTRVDASAGGYSAASSNPWVYVRFTPEGAERIEIDDETALESIEWHIAARRFILRTNGGENSPSCVGVAEQDDDYDDLSQVPTDVEWAVDAYYDEDCELQQDNSGLPGSPPMALGAWWSYEGCLKTTDVPFLIRLDDGSVIKLVVEQYYLEADEQEACNADGTTPSNSSHAAHFTWRWRFLE